MSTCATGLTASPGLRTHPGVPACARPARGKSACHLLAEKDLLLKELGHRVRNSLNVIASLACIESERIADSEAAASIERLKSRVAATALLYERLENGHGAARLRADLYIEDIVRLAVESLALEPGRVEVSLELAPLSLDARSAGALGLIVNEAVTNAFKYGILQGGGRKLRVALEAPRGEPRSLVVEDDGPGFPVGFEPLRDGDFGFELMIHEASGIGGRLGISGAEWGEGGARIEIRFPGGTRVRAKP